MQVKAKLSLSVNTLRVNASLVRTARAAIDSAAPQVVEVLEPQPTTRRISDTHSLYPRNEYAQIRPTESANPPLTPLLAPTKVLLRLAKNPNGTRKTTTTAERNANANKSSKPGSRTRRTNSPLARAAPQLLLLPLLPRPRRGGPMTVN